MYVLQYAYFKNYAVSRIFRFKKILCFSFSFLVFPSTLFLMWFLSLFVFMDTALAQPVDYGGSSSQSHNRGLFQRMENRRQNQNNVFLPLGHQREKPQNTATDMMVFSPHPDDEILCCGEMISMALKSGKSVKVVYLTNGDGLTTKSKEMSQNYGKTRRRESILAARSLGLRSKDLFFLNFPDGHLSDLEWNKDIRSDFTRQAKTNALSYRPGAGYSLNELSDIVRELIDNYDPEMVYIPHEGLDTHKDHRATAQGVQHVLRDFPGIKVLKYQVHGIKTPQTQKLNNQKLALIQKFQSQYHDVWHKNFLERFAQIKEIFY